MKNKFEINYEKLSKIDEAIKKINFEKINRFNDNLEIYLELFDSKKILKETVYKNAFISLLKRRSSLGTTLIEKQLLEYYENIFTTTPTLDGMKSSISKRKEKGEYERHKYFEEAYYIVEEYHRMFDLKEVDILSLEFIKQVHNNIFKKTQKEIAGRFKTDKENNMVLTQEQSKYPNVQINFISSEHTVETLKDMFYFIKNNNLDPVINTSIIHFLMVAIHPFVDGNGRVARLLSTIYFFKTTNIFLPIDDVLSVNPNEYRLHLDNLFIENNVVDFVEYSIDKYIQQIKTNNNLYKSFETAIPILMDKIVKTKIKKSYYDNVISMLLSRTTTNYSDFSYFFNKIDIRTIKKITDELLKNKLLRKTKKIGRSITFEIVDKDELF